MCSVRAGSGRAWTRGRRSQRDAGLPPPEVHPPNSQGVRDGEASEPAGRDVAPGLSF